MLAELTGDGGTKPADARGPDARSGDALVDTVSNPCPGSYTLTFGTHRYRVTTVGTRASVAADCTNEGQHLIKLESAQENEFARSTLAPAGAGGSYFWIGLTWNGADWVWDDGSVLGTYENFSGAVPTGSSNPCVDVSYSSGTWAEYQCMSPPHDSLCECDGS